MKMTCKRCGELGHDKRTCNSTIPREANLQPVSQTDTQQDIQLDTSKGKQKVSTSIEKQSQEKLKKKEQSFELTHFNVEMKIGFLDY